jgi:hypothetical protein
VTDPATATFTITQPAGQISQWDNVWTHNFTVTVQPDGTFAGTGVESGQDQNGPQTFNETVSGTFANNTVSLTVSRDDGVVFSLANAPTDGSTVTVATSTPQVGWPLEFKATAPVMSAPTTTDLNHGQYVKWQGGGKEAAQACAGMPLNSAQGH